MVLWQNGSIYRVKNLYRRKILFDLDFSGKHIVLVDSSYDMGPAIQKAFLEQGGYVSSITSLSVNNCNSEKNLNVLQIPDFSKESICESINCCIKKWGNIDIFIYNDKTASHPNVPIWDYDNEDWKNIYEHNINRVFYFVKAIVPHMTKKEGGTILFISTTSSYITIQEEYMKVSPAYESANAALNRFAKHLAKDLGESGINVNTLCPGNIDKPAIHNLIQSISEKSGQEKEKVLYRLVNRQAIKKLIPQEDVIYQVLHLCSRHSKYITGENIVISGGLGI